MGRWRVGRKSSWGSYGWLREGKWCYIHVGWSWAWFVSFFYLYITGIFIFDWGITIYFYSRLTFTLGGDSKSYFPWASYPSLETKGYPELVVPNVPPRFSDAILK